MTDKLQALRHVAEQARACELKITDLEDQLKEKKAELTTMFQKTMPDMFDELRLDHLGMPAVGNLPARDYRMRPFYAASIAASWLPERRQAAFDLLTKLKAESLIKNEVTAKFPKGQGKVAKQLIDAAKKLGVIVENKLSVHSGTLSAWLRELYERGQSLSQSDLEKIGGSVGRVVRAEERET